MLLLLADLCSELPLGERRDLGLLVPDTELLLGPKLGELLALFFLIPVGVPSALLAESMAELSINSQSSTLFNSVSSRSLVCWELE